MSLKIRKCQKDRILAQKMITIPRKAPHQNGIWPYNPQNICGCHGITKQSMKNHEPKISLEKALDRSTTKILRNPQHSGSMASQTASISSWDGDAPCHGCQRSAGGVTRPHMQPTREGSGTGQNEEGGTCGSRTRFAASGLSGEARRRLTLLLVTVVRSHVPSRCVFQKLTPLPVNLLLRMFGISPIVF